MDSIVLYSTLECYYLHIIVNYQALYHPRGKGHWQLNSLSSIIVSHIKMTSILCCISQQNFN